jgi:arabinan endo-1,5-alpha-L-arabinosidase
MNALRSGCILLVCLAGVGRASGTDIVFRASYDQSVQAEKSAGALVGGVSESPPRFVPGIQGQAVVVGASTWVQYPAVGNLPAAQGTIAFLTKPIGWAGNDGLHHFFLSAQAGPGDWLIVYKTPENKFLFTGGNTANYSYAETAAADWPDGQWKHVGVIWDNGAARIYFDGELVAQGTWPVAAKSFGNEFIVGGTVFGKSSGEQAIDELTIYNAALGKNEVATLFAKYKDALAKANAALKKKP